MAEEDVFGSDFERWDPRKEVFLSDTNTYTKQNDDFLPPLPSINVNRWKNTKIQIKNVPTPLNENGIRNLFSKAGKVRSVEFERSSSVINNVRNCIVEMANGAEIERAIRLFNNFKITNDPPLQVRIAMTRRQKEERQKIKQSEILMVKNLLKREENQIYEARSLPGFEKFVEDISFFEDKKPVASAKESNVDDLWTENETYVAHPEADREIFTIDDSEENLIRFESKNDAERFMTEVYVEHKCAVCEKKCCFVCECERCSYCSIKCQENHWNIHQKFCFVFIK